MSNKSNAYDRFKAHLLNKSKKTVNTGGSTSETSKTVTVSPEIVPPTSSAVPDLSFARDTSATPSPSRARKTSIIGTDNLHKVGSEKTLNPSTAISIVRNSTTSVSLKNTLSEVKGSVLVPEGEVEQLRARVKTVEIEKRVVEGEKFELSSKVSKLEARLALES
ncbi:hypothetical protein PIB30_040270 [Stylosanthes scabra]|uniref:Uncharacterized protein n=1 Tax=Stylosanthes scabra TaxID=79078 RepID=A0ABU6WEK1_9FABA|nr:hypothetical protein [Stylosanthes scabra]